MKIMRQYVLKGNGVADIEVQRQKDPWSMWGHRGTPDTGRLQYTREGSLQKRRLQGRQGPGKELCGANESDGRAVESQWSKHQTKWCRQTWTPFWCPKSMYIHPKAWQVALDKSHVCHNWCTLQFRYNSRLQHHHCSNYSYCGLQMQTFLNVWFSWITHTGTLLPFSLWCPGFWKEKNTSKKWYCLKEFPPHHLKASLQSRMLYFQLSIRTVTEV